MDSDSAAVPLGFPLCQVVEGGQKVPMATAGYFGGFFFPVFII